MSSDLEKEEKIEFSSNPSPTLGDNARHVDTYGVWIKGDVSDTTKSESPEDAKGSAEEIEEFKDIDLSLFFQSEGSSKEDEKEAEQFLEHVNEGTWGAWENDQSDEDLVFEDINFDEIALEEKVSPNLKIPLESFDKDDAENLGKMFSLFSPMTEDDENGENTIENKDYPSVENFVELAEEPEDSTDEFSSFLASLSDGEENPEFDTFLHNINQDDNTAASSFSLEKKETIFKDSQPVDIDLEFEEELGQHAKRTLDELKAVMLEDEPSGFEVAETTEFDEFISSLDTVPQPESGNVPLEEEPYGFEVAETAEPDEFISSLDTVPQPESSAEPLLKEEEPETADTASTDFQQDENYSKSGQNPNALERDLMFDDISAFEKDLGFNDEGEMNDRSNEMLLTIAKELSSIKEELNALKQEASSKESKAQEEDMLDTFDDIAECEAQNSAPSGAGSFFEDEENQSGNGERAGFKDFEEDGLSENSFSASERSSGDDELLDFVLDAGEEETSALNDTEELDFLHEGESDSDEVFIDIPDIEDLEVDKLSDAQEGDASLVDERQEEDELTEHLFDGILQDSLEYSKKDIKSLFLYLDELLENLPAEKMEEFKQSRHFGVYKMLSGELGIS